MFATLIVQLPTRCQGGDLICRFADKKYTFDFGNKTGDAEFSVYYAAHYADVHHQVNKITSGARLVLVYNLIQPIQERLLSAAYHHQLLHSVTEMIPSIFSLLEQEQHGFLLEHEYTEQSLSDLGLQAMKGQDQDLIKAFLAINQSLPLEQQLSFLISRVSYSVSSDGSGSGYYGDDVLDPDMLDWYIIDSSKPGCDLCFNDQGLSIPVSDFAIDWVHDLNQSQPISTAFADLDEDFWGEGDEDIEGFMGNYGPSKETVYAKYLLVLMPAYPNHAVNDQGLALQTQRVLSMAQDLSDHQNFEWLQQRFDLALQHIEKQLNHMLCKSETTYQWHTRLDQCREFMFIQLMKTAILRDDHCLCSRMINMIASKLVAELSLSNSFELVIAMLKNAIDHFQWQTLSASVIPVITELSGDVALSLATTLSVNSSDVTMRTELILICVSRVCDEQESWGRSCCFETTILPLALCLSTKNWHATTASKQLFLNTCMAQGTEHPSLLSVLIRKLSADTTADHKEWLLSVMIESRLQYLQQELTQNPQEFTWRMPDADISNSAMVAFLRGEQRQIQIRDYNGIAMARRDVITISSESILPAFYMESNNKFVQPNKPYGFSATMKAKGRGKQAYVEITKDKTYHQLCLKLRELRQQELKQLQQMIVSER